jgi:hypothetical protein
MSVVEASHPVAPQAPFHPKAGYPRHRWTVAESTLFSFFSHSVHQVEKPL